MIELDLNRDAPALDPRVQLAEQTLEINEKIQKDNSRDRELVDTGSNYKYIILSPYNVARLVFETTKNYLLRTKPSELGLLLDATYSLDPQKSSIHLGMAFDIDLAATNKRPAVFIQRGPAQTSAPTMGQRINIDVKESIVTKLHVTEMPVAIKIIGAPVANVEIIS